MHAFRVFKEEISKLIYVFVTAKDFEKPAKVTKSHHHQSSNMFSVQPNCIAEKISIYFLTCMIFFTSFDQPVDIYKDAHIYVNGGILSCISHSEIHCLGGGGNIRNNIMLNVTRRELLVLYNMYHLSLSSV